MDGVSAGITSKMSTARAAGRASVVVVALGALAAVPAVRAKHVVLEIERLGHSLD